MTLRMSTPSMRIAPGADVVEPRQQVHERRLAGAAAPDDGHHLTGADGERHVVQNPARPLVVAEAHVAELDLLAERRQRRPRLAAL